MSWIKRNLLFVIGTLVALGLLACAGYYSFSRWKLNATVRDQLNVQYEELNRLNNLNPHPGKGTVDNIAAAREQRNMLTNVLQRAAGQFVPITPIPPLGELTSKDFAAALRQTIARLQRDADTASVLLPPDYSFSFSVQRQALTFAGSLEPLAVQLGAVKAICDIFNNAKVNSLDGIRRERVSTDDFKGPQTDYVEEQSQTNELAVISPYEISFRCFSPELADVLAQFANSPHGFVVKSMNVEPASATGAGDAMMGQQYGAVQPGYRPTRYAEDDPIAARLRARNMYAGAPAPAPVPTAASSRGGLQTFVDEKQIQVTMLVEVITLLPKK